jgi:hypothetical protein
MSTGRSQQRLEFTHENLLDYKTKTIFVKFWHYTSRGYILRGCIECAAAGGVLRVWNCYVSGLGSNYRVKIYSIIKRRQTSLNLGTTLSWGCVLRSCIECVAAVGVLRVSRLI